MDEPIGEDSWLDSVDEASRSAKDLELRIEVVELFKRAVGAEPYSLRIWTAYSEWVWSLYTDCQSADAGWPEEEQLLGQELFSLEVVIDIWQQGAVATQLRLDDSHVLWNKWISIELEELEKSADPPAIERVRGIFIDRLQIPHAKWEDTSQMFSSFITKYDESAWETTMVAITDLAKDAKKIYNLREAHELNLSKAVESGDKDAQKEVILDYLAWEAIQCTKKNGWPALLYVLFERALLLFNTDADIWEDYVSTISVHAHGLGTKSADLDSVVSASFATPNALSLLQRATSHCPWSGGLWSRYILQVEGDGFPFSQVEHIKQTAIGSGQLDRNGMIDVLAVYSAWCGFLRRRAFAEDASDEDVDNAKSGLPSALESSRAWGERLYGKNIYKGDPSFRIEQCLIQYLSQKGSISEARSNWQMLVKSRGDSYEFWQRYYNWEMTYGDDDQTRPFATAVLRQAARRISLDWPEKIMENYIQHCENYADISTLAAAVNHVHTNSKVVAKRRYREAIDAAAVYDTQLDQKAEPVPAGQTVEDSPSGASKRKRDSAVDADDRVSKKFKSDGNESQISQHLKRDRENTSVLVTNLPPDATQTRIRQFFKEYGHINNLAVRVESDGDSSSALVEFRSAEDVQSAMLKDGKYFGDKEIHVEAGTGLTLYVTNYPPAADEAYIRNLFSECGEIFSIRWPSLKYNTHRRFCYVSFRSVNAASAATQLDGRLLEGRYKLEAKYSDPGRKKSREGAAAEGRELHVANIDRTATEDELREIFSKYGKIEAVRILRNLAGKSKGGGFIVFEQKGDATQALELDKTKFKTQIMTVEVSTHSNYKPTATSLGVKASSASPAPDAGSDAGTPNSPLPQADSPISENQKQHEPSRAEIAARTITLLNVPDTVNDARIRALVEPFGAIVKLALRPDHQGAIIEFVDVASVGKAALSLENYEIAPGRKLRTGGIRDLLREKGETKTDRIQIGSSSGSKKPAPTASGFMQPSAPIRRPGGRGGLGTKRGLGYSAVTLSKRPPGGDHMNDIGANEGANGSENMNEEKVLPRSNADFKAMFLKGKGT